MKSLRDDFAVCYVTAVSRRTVVSVRQTFFHPAVPRFIVLITNGITREPFVSTRFNTLVLDCCEVGASRNIFRWHLLDGILIVG